MRRHDQLYRTPPNPGFVGGYNWSALLLGLTLLTAANVAATQYVGQKFRCQPALGRPVLTIGTTCVYQPFQWATWVLQHGSNPNPRIRLHILTGALIVVIGAAATVGMVYALNMSRARRLSTNTEDLHGSARWATKADVEETGLLDSPQGVYVGGWFDPDSKRVHYLRHDGPEHILAFAPTRSGKGVGLVIPTLLAWSESAVVYDIKGENWAKTAGFRNSQGHLCLKFSPVEPGSGSRFNPLAELRIGTLREVSDCQNAADILIRTSDNPADPYWQEAAADLTTALLLHVCYESAADGRIASLSDLVAIFSRPGETFRDTLNELENFPHDPGHRYGWRTRTGERTITHPVVREHVRKMLNKEDKDFSGVLSAATTPLSLYSDPLVVRNISASDFTVNDLVNHEHPISLFLVVPNSDRMRLRPLLRLILTVIVNRLTERMEFEGAEQKPNRYRLLFMIDEFPSLERMKVFSDALSYMAGYGLKAYLITQDIRQIIAEYGPNESIVSNCQVRVAYAPNQLETAELLSKMTGTQTVQKASFNFSGPRLAPVADHMTASVEQVERPLMTPDEVMRIRPPKKKGRGAKERIVAPGDMLIFVSGHYPIYGKQILFFSDPVLSARAAIAPPTKFKAINHGRSIRSAVIDRPETPSRMEKAFLAGINRGFI